MEAYFSMSGRLLVLAALFLTIDTSYSVLETLGTPAFCKDILPHVTTRRLRRVANGDGGDTSGQCLQPF